MTTSNRHARQENAIVRLVHHKDSGTYNRNGTDKYWAVICDTPANIDLLINSDNFNWFLKSQSFSDYDGPTISVAGYLRKIGMWCPGVVTY